MDSAKLKENLFAVANRARGGRKCWGHILLPVLGAVAQLGLSRVPQGAGWAWHGDTPLLPSPSSICSEVTQRQEQVGVTRRRLRWQEGGGVAGGRL